MQTHKGKIIKAKEVNGGLSIRYTNSAAAKSDPVNGDGELYIGSGESPELAFIATSTGKSIEVTTDAKSLVKNVTIDARPVLSR